MKKFHLPLAALIFILSMSVSSVNTAAAATINYNNVISDVVFDNTNTMNAAQVDAFLNTFPNSCISTNRGFSSPDPTGFNPTQGFLFGGNVSAGTVIYHAAQAYDMNPQVLLTTLQKEQSLVSGTAGCYPNTPDKNTAYPCNLYNNGTIYSCTKACPYGGGCVPIAVGYGCPGQCNAAQEGFSQQIIRAAWRLSFDRHRAEGQADWYIMKPNWDNSDDAQSCYNGPMTQGLYRICPSGAASYFDGYWEPVPGVHMDNGATAALYHYTPFTHGQELFFNIFTSWFGTTQSTELVRTSSDPTVYLLSGATKYPIPSYEMLNEVGTFGPVSFVPQSLLDEFTTGAVMNRSIKSTSSSTVYFISNGTKHSFPSCEMMVDYGLYCGGEITLTDQQVSQYTGGATMTNLVHTSDNKDFYVSAGKIHQVFDSTSLQQAGITGTYLNFDSSALFGLALSTPVIRDNVVAQSNVTGSSYFYASNKFVNIPSDLMGSAAFSKLTKKTFDSASINTLAIDRSFTGFMKGSDGSEYIIDKQGKTKLDDSSIWTGNYVLFNDSFLSQVPNSIQPINNAFIKSPSGSTIYIVVGGKKHPILSWADFINLHTDKSSAFSTLADTTVGSIETGTGAVAPGTLIKAPDSRTVYVVNAMFQKMPLKSFDISEDLGIRYYIVIPDAVVNAYSTQTLASTFIQCNDKEYVGNSGLLYEVTTQVATDYGWTTTSYDAWDSLACSNVTFASNPLPQFIKTADKVTIYQVKDGSKHPIGSYATYSSLGGNESNTLIVSNNFINLITTGAVIP